MVLQKRLVTSRQIFLQCLAFVSSLSATFSGEKVIVNRLNREIQFMSISHGKHLSSFPAFSAERVIVTSLKIGTQHMSILHTASPVPSPRRGERDRVRGLLFCIFLITLMLSFPTSADNTIPSTTMVYDHLHSQAREHLDARNETYEALETESDLNAYQQRLKQFFIERIGGEPERTPLNPRITGTIEGDGYRIEKVIFESMPGIYVTGLMYLPVEGEGPYPGILIACGHDINGKAAEPYQQLGILFARNGMAAFCFDPMGQGERRQILDENGQAVTGSVPEHMYIGTGAMLFGLDAATYSIWDGMRAIDYLSSRPEVDATRLGCTGISGGGTQTSYLMALDDRIQAAAPVCYITGYERLLETIGPQDFEQNIHGALAHGMDHGDYLLMRAPKPTLICASTDDFFDIQGTWQTYREAKRMYTRLGYPERIEIAEAPGGHAWHPPLRTAVARWMSRWLRGIDEPIEERDKPILGDEDTWCTPTGEVLHLDGARSISDYHVELAEKYKAEREAKWGSESTEARLEAVRELAGVRTIDAMPEPSVEVRSESAVEGGRGVELWVTVEHGIVLPVTLLVPDNADGAIRLVLDGVSRQNALGSHAAREAFAAGHPVALADLRGIGELESNRYQGGWAEPFGNDWQETMLALLLERSMLGMRADDCIALSRALSAAEVEGLPEGRSVHLIANGEAIPPALHAAALEPQLFASLEQTSELIPWDTVARTPLIQNQFVNAVWGALKEYDLPDLQRAYESKVGR
jgi:dienelactone hydrolase